MPEETLDPAGTATTPTSPAAEPKLAPDVIAKMIYEINAEAIRREVEALISKPRCAAFVKELLKRAAENAPPQNKLLEDGDVMKLFDLIMKQKKIIRHDPKLDPFSPPNCALGRVNEGTGCIQIGNFRPGLPATASELKVLYPKKDAELVLHELIHHAGALIYDDQHMAEVVSAMVEDVDSLDEHSAFVIRRLVRDKKHEMPTTGTALDYSWYWDQALQYSYK